MTVYDVQLHSVHQLLVSLLMVLKTQSDDGSKNRLELTVSMPSLPCHNVLDSCNSAAFDAN